MTEYYLFQKAEVWYRAKVEAENPAHALRLNHIGKVDTWEILPDTTTNVGEIEVEPVVKGDAE